ncbi:MAG: hypothetical protein ABI375_00470 [Rudaea sp.]
MASRAADTADRIASQNLRRDMFERTLTLLESHSLTPAGIAAIDLDAGAQRFKILPPLLKRTLPELAETIERAYILSMAAREIAKFHTLGLPRDWDAALQGFAETLEQERALRYERGWRGKHERFSIETAADYVKGAAAFLRKLHELGVSDLRLIIQHHMDVFAIHCSSSRRTAMVRFVRWAKPKYGLIGRFISPTRRQGHRRKPVLSQTQLREFVRAIGASRVSLPIRISALMCALYAQPLARTTSRSIRDFDVQANSIRVAFGRMPITLDSLTADLLRQWLPERETMLAARRHESESLFPSANGGQALLGSTLSKTINKAFGYSPIQLRATALHNVIRSGKVREANQLAAYFGVSYSAARHALMENGRLLFEATPEGAGTLGALMRNELDR